MLWNCRAEFQCHNNLFPHTPPLISLINYINYQWWSELSTTDSIPRWTSYHLQQTKNINLHCNFAELMLL